jgi:hypothetical protein
MSLFRAPVNNASLDPMQGFDVEVWVTDVATGQILDIGQFQSCTLTIRNATETYLPLGQRIPTYLDGEIQIAWVLERGKLSTNFLTSWFGTSNINKDQYLTRGPRFQISIDLNAVEFKNPVDTKYIYESVAVKSNATDFFRPTGATAGYFESPEDRASSGSEQGRLEIVRCKLDSFSEGIMPGRRVIANRWEGVAEGVLFSRASQQTFKENDPRIFDTQFG